jgi:hypothetical protein
VDRPKFALFCLALRAKIALLAITARPYRGKARMKTSIEESLWGRFKLAVDKISGISFLRVRLALGAEGVDDGDLSAANPLPTGPSAKEVTTLLDAVTTNQTSQAHAIKRGRRTLQASIAGTGAVSATVTWYGSNGQSASGGVVIATMSLSGTNSDVQGADIASEWPHVYCVLLAISGTGAAVTATVGV